MYKNRKGPIPFIQGLAISLPSDKLSSLPPPNKQASTVADHPQSLPLRKRIQLLLNQSISSTALSLTSVRMHFLPIKTASVDEADKSLSRASSKRVGLPLLFPLSGLPSYTVTGSQYIGKQHWTCLPYPREGLAVTISILCIGLKARRMYLLAPSPS